MPYLPSGGGGGATSIGGAVSGGTEGSVLFLGASGVMSQDNADFAYNTTTNILTLSGGIAGGSGWTLSANAGNYALQLGVSNAGDYIAGSAVGDVVFRNIASGKSILVSHDSGGAAVTINSTSTTVAALATTRVPLTVSLAAAQSADALQVKNSGGTTIFKVLAGGGVEPASMADSSAPNNSIYYSTTASKLVYKDSGGTVNNLY